MLTSTELLHCNMI